MARVCAYVSILQETCVVPVLQDSCNVVDGRGHLLGVVDARRDSDTRYMYSACPTSSHTALQMHIHRTHRQLQASLHVFQLLVRCSYTLLRPLLCSLYLVTTFQPHPHAVNDHTHYRLGPLCQCPEVRALPHVPRTASLSPPCNTSLHHKAHVPHRRHGSSGCRGAQNSGGRQSLQDIQDQEERERKSREASAAVAAKARTRAAPAVGGAALNSAWALGLRLLPQHARALPNRLSMLLSS